VRHGSQRPTFIRFDSWRLVYRKQNYDGAEPTEERQTDYLEGSAKTGNASKDEDGKALGNVVPSEVGEKFNDIRKKAAFAKNQKEKSYEKDAQPVKEEINRYKQIIGHKYSSQ